MSPILFLTGAEQKLFSSLPDALKEGWQIVEENGKAYESDDVLRMRARMAAKESTEVAEFFDRWDKAKGKAIGLPKLTDTQMLEFFFALGAKGISPFIETLLTEAKTDDDIAGVEHLSILRHRLLKINALSVPA